MAITVTADAVRTLQGYPEGRFWFLAATVVGAAADVVNVSDLVASSNQIPSTAIVTNGTFNRTTFPSRNTTTGTFITILGQTGAGTIVVGGTGVTPSWAGQHGLWQIETGLTATINVWLREA